ncbi:AAA family ATPase [Crossiella sp. SN42]|uniref:ATP-binding protein n=1 Tax=Crossiella sp. SN42 TaxID=2944808 RepID=UPI00207CD52D|nr:AAA family ATPase [Crossiella sp. SN42]MCO1579175.1 AAA family ATPase [Crossiella sp. SN42]
MRTPDSAVLERESELSRIEAALDSAARGEGRVVLIEGRAGIGKTRLVQATRDLATCRSRWSWPPARPRRTPGRWPS